MMSMPQLSASFSSSSVEIGAPAAEELGEHFAEVDPHLRERFGEKFFGRLVDPRDDVEQLAARVREVGVLRFEEGVALLQLVVFVHGIEVHRPHRVELAGQLVDDFAELRFVEICRLVVGRFRFGFPALLDLGTEGFGEGITIGRKLAQIDLVTPHHMLGEAFDLQLHLRLADFLLAARIVQIAERFAAGRADRSPRRLPRPGARRASRRLSATADSARESSALFSSIERSAAAVSVLCCSRRAW